MSHRRLSDIVVDDQIGAEAAGATSMVSRHPPEHDNTATSISAADAETIGRSLNSSSRCSWTSNECCWDSSAINPAERRHCCQQSSRRGDRSDSALDVFQASNEGKQMLPFQIEGRRYQRPADQ